MLWGSDQISEFQSMVVAGYASYVLGFNEPNQSGESNMTPAEGASMWMEYIQPLKDQGYYLISPACTNADTGIPWQQQFLGNCTGCTVDAMAFHFYDTDAQNLIDYANQFYDTFGLPVWITEFADENFSGTGGQSTQDEVNSFAATVAAFVNETPWIEAAFPFDWSTNLAGVNTANQLLGDDGNPTSLAYTYYG